MGKVYVNEYEAMWDFLYWLVVRAKHEKTIETMRACEEFDWAEWIKKGQPEIGIFKEISNEKRHIFYMDEVEEVGGTNA